METTQMPVNQWLDKNVVFVYSGILFSQEKWRNPAIRHKQMDLEGIMFTEISRIRQILYDIAYMWNIKKRLERWLSEIRGGGGGDWGCVVKGINLQLEDKL